MPAPKRPIMRVVADYMAMAIMLPLSTVIGYGLGYALDVAFGTTWQRILWLVFGILAGFKQLLQQIQKDVAGGVESDNRDPFSGKDGTANKQDPEE